MALQNNVVLENGVEVKGAYIKIVSVASDKINANITVSYYADRTKKAFYQKIFIFKPEFNDESVNLWKQGYEFLKACPEFAGAEDILEDGQHA